MRHLVTAALFALRLFSVWFLAINTLGILWFLGQHGFITLVYFWVTSLALVAYAFMPRRLIAQAPYRKIVVSLAVVATFVTFHEIYGDLTLINGADYPAAKTRLLECGIFIAMIFEALNLPRKVRIA